MLKLRAWGDFQIESQVCLNTCTQGMKLCQASPEKKTLVIKFPNYLLSSEHLFSGRQQQVPRYVGEF